MRKLLFVEDYYQLYIYNGLNASSLSLRNKIFFLKQAIKIADKDEWWFHPTRSFAYPKASWSNPILLEQNFQEIHHKKYKLLIKMNLHFFLMQEFIHLASRYDRKNIFWFHRENYSSYAFRKKDWKQEHYLLKSFKVAKLHYLNAKKHWDNCKNLVIQLFENSVFNSYTQKEIHYKNIRFYNAFMHKLENKAFQIYYQNDPQYKKEKTYHQNNALPKYNYSYMIQKFLEDLDKKEDLLNKIIR